MLKPGDRVVCVAVPLDWCSPLCVGDVYTVLEQDEPDNVYLAEITGGYFPSRFEELSRR